MSAKDGDKIIVGTSWYQIFMKRNKHLLRRCRCHVKDTKRRTCCTYENFSNMYDGVYEAMVESGVAEKLDKQVMYDVSGEETDDKTKMYGRPSTYRLLHPEMVLFVDETGCNTNQKEDLAGGELHVLPQDKSLEFGVTGATTDNRFTVLCFTNGNGVPVLCAIIMRSSKDITEIPLNWKLGIDITKDLKTGETTQKILEANYGEGKAMSGGPKCTYNGVEIPSFVGCSPNASITAEMLAAMLQTLDERNVFDLSNNINPVLILDRHGSRIQLEFLKYINDDNHKWSVCLGVPYGTHLWQVGDAPQLNGAFKIVLYKEKKEYLKHRLEKKYVPTDIIPLINKACKSFAKSEKAKRAIVRRGWNPMNYVLLDNPNVIKEATINEKEVELTGDEKSGDTTITDSRTGETTVKLSSSIQANLSGATVTDYMGCLLSEVKKDENRMKKYEEQKLRRFQKQSEVKKLALLTNVTSGQLAINDRWTLGPGVMQKVQEKENKKNRKVDEAKNRKLKQQENNVNKFHRSYLKYTNNETLNVDDMKQLIKRVSTSDDSPIRSKKVDLQQQWEKRRCRLDIFCTPQRDAPSATNCDTHVPHVPITGDITESEIMGSGVSDFLVSEQNYENSDAPSENSF